MLKQNRKPRPWVERDPIEAAKLHARSVFQTICELRTAQAVNDPADAEAYEMEIREVGQALANANRKVAALEARRSQS